MSPYQPSRTALARGSLLIVFALLISLASSQTMKLRGMIKARSGATMIVQTADAPHLVVLLTDRTQVGQIQGALKVRRKEMSMAALIPGLEVQIEGTANDQNQIVATLIKFEGGDLERAQSIQAGLHLTEMQAQANRQALEKQTEELKAQTEELKAQSEALKKQGEKINANKAAIDAAIARFGQLDEYYIFDEVTVLFGNGKVAVEPTYKPQLVQLAQKAKTIEAYMIQVVGYASSSGSATLNQKLSEDRAANVTNILMQDGKIPMTNLLAPGAMGESEQVGDNSTDQGEAQNRRVVVRVLQNKGIAGLQTAH
jgi:OOP family OmpA-OmpF porin